MSESIRSGGHNHNKTESLGINTPEFPDKSSEVSGRQELHHKTNRPELNKETIAQNVDQLAISSKEITAVTFEKEQPNHHPILVNKQLKDTAYSRSMLRTRKQLSLGNRTFSKFIHAQIIDKSSNAVGKTIARPSGILGGALLASLGSLITLWATKHNGYEYNYLIVIILFAIGLAFGLATELAIKLIKKSR